MADMDAESVKPYENDDEKNADKKNWEPCI